jgi:hypothetical protein
MVELLNLFVLLATLMYDFFVIDAYYDKHYHIILGRPFLMSVDAILDAGEGKVTINLNGNKYPYDFLHASSFASPLPPEEEEEVGSLCFVETLRDPLERA